MTKQEYRAAIDGVIYLAGCAVKGETPEADRVAAMNLEQVLQAAREHKLAAAVGMALEKTGLADDAFHKAIAMAQRKVALLDADRAAVLAQLEASGIWYMPLKGAILKNLYPRFGMREMVDNDILIDGDRALDVRRIMEGLGFEVKDFNRDPDDTYRKPPVSNFEMHKALFPKQLLAEQYAYYIDVKSRLIKDEGNRYGFHFTDEDFYLYMISHEHKHYIMGGTGLRSLLDTYVYLNRVALDMNYVVSEAEKIGIADYERQNRALALHLFGGKTLTEDEQRMLDYIASSGAYGTMEHFASNRIEEKGRWGYLMSRLFPKRKELELLYPFLKKTVLLYPLCCVLHLLRGLLHYRENYSKNLKAIFELNKEKHEK